MNPKISIIIPVFNVEQYLEQCLDSCINQTLKEIEIICVDDNSTDNSAKILKKYAKKDKRIQVYTHDKNYCAGIARNTGLEHAKGEYIWFVDSDDYLQLNACKILYNTAVTNNLDILNFTGTMFTDENGIETILKGQVASTFNRNTIYNFKKFSDKYKLDSQSLVWLNLYKTSLAKQFKFGSHYYEDTDYCIFTLVNSERLMAIDYCAIYYRLRNTSYSHEKKTQKHLYGFFQTLICMEDYINKTKATKNSYIYRYFLLKTYYHLKFTKSHYNLFNEELKKLYKHFKKYCRFYIFFNKIKHYLSFFVPYGFYKIKEKIDNK